MGNSGKAGRGLVAGLATAGAAAVAVTVLQAPAQAQEGEILGGGADAVADSYLVVLKDEHAARDRSAIGQVTSAVAGTARRLVHNYGGTVTRSFGAAIPGFAITANETQAKRLAANSAVKFVARNQRVHASETQQNPTWGLDRVDQRDLPLDKKYTYAGRAENVTAYVVDTGVLAGHQEFGGRVAGGRDFIGNDDDATDENGHGTHVAGTIGGQTYGVAKGVRIVPVRVLDAQGGGTTEQVVAGINYVTESATGPSVANMSLGGGVDRVLDEAVRGAIAKGVTFGVAAGNDAANANNYSPARVKEAITVAASTNTDAQASFSNYGSVVDLYAPGRDITSAWHTGPTARNTISGTSMATPHVVGAAALYLSANPSANPAAVSQALTTAATPGKITNPGPGTPNKLLYTGP